ncbi:hypothetical protein RCL1_006232 [Eukaryota sp. TZLM3-RCL]
MSKLPSHSPTLGFEGLTLYQSDVNYLAPGRWINDNILSFMMLYYRHLHPNLNISFVQPSAVMLLKLASPEDAKQVVTSSKFSTSDLVIMAVSDASLAEASIVEAGSHWSVLVYYRKDHIFYHFDSLQGHNSEVASELALSISELLNISKVAMFEDLACEQQTNGYDCGVFCVVFFYRIVQAYMESLKENAQSFDVLLREYAMGQILAIKTRKYVWDCIVEVISEVEQKEKVSIGLLPPC